MECIKYPIGIQSFEEIRKNQYLYLDKTEFIYDIVESGKYYFLSRPRRFGKSLLISTIEALFSGKRDLFEGLFIAGTDWKWDEFPVFHLDLNVRNYETSDGLVDILGRHLDEWEAKWGVNNSFSLPEDRFLAIIKHAFKVSGRQVVILVDEYDKPLLRAMHDDSLMTSYRNLLQAFYGVLKSLDSYIRFAMLTGVTKFGKVNIFSGLNNLNDITLSTKYNSICGITEQEITDYFAAGVAAMATDLGESPEWIRAKLKEYYDGYHFSSNLEDVYNPFSVLCAFENRDFGSYWFETGTPTFLVELMKQHDYRLSKLQGSMRTELELKSSDTFRQDPVPMFFQAGYLTIKDYNRKGRFFILDYPNREVEESFLSFLMPYYSPKYDRDAPVFHLAECAERGDAEEFMKILATFFRDFP